ncbi:hypothetical protein GRF29_28g2599761 [Pseudopithomyces chartarum]|uniref:Uncharacterized protein n=1 Tax=Pseudopithomyces chartarum TaxID=1892770 RepID=A0AAN6RJR8_9PLEO|nr:hypothetical protein GRF29_28g2599761 [Pseudopithomyces chartarum]
MMNAIQYVDRAKEDETLFATYLLTLYEVFVGITSGHGFFYHVQGLLHLLKQRGPDSFGNRLNMQLFHAIRYNSLSIGYHVRKGSMLDAPEWMAVTSKASKIDPYVALIDLCIQIPRLLERTDKLDPTDVSSANTLIEDSLSLAASAKAWFAGFEKHGPRYTSMDVDDFEGFKNICEDRTFDSAYNFYAFGAGICYMIYWMSMLILQSNTFKLCMKFRSLQPKEMYLWDRELGGYADSSSSQPALFHIIGDNGRPLQNPPRITSYFLHNISRRLHRPNKTNTSPSISYHPPMRTPCIIAPLHLLFVQPHILLIHHTSFLIFMPFILYHPSIVPSRPPPSLLQPITQRRPHRRHTPVTPLYQLPLPSSCYPALLRNKKPRPHHGPIGSQRHRSSYTPSICNTTRSYDRDLRAAHRCKPIFDLRN